MGSCTSVDGSQDDRDGAKSESGCKKPTEVRVNSNNVDKGQETPGCTDRSQYEESVERIKESFTDIQKRIHMIQTNIDTVNRALVLYLEIDSQSNPQSHPEQTVDASGAEALADDVADDCVPVQENGVENISETDEQDNVIQKESLPSMKVRTADAETNDAAMKPTLQAHMSEFQDHMNHLQANMDSVNALAASLFEKI